MLRRMTFWLLMLILLVVKAVPVLPQSNEGACQGFEPRLEVGGRGQVTEGSANNIRSEPTSSAERLGQIPGSESFVVLDGPRCADGITWWQVEYEGIIGWTGEGNSSSYWTMPLSDDSDNDEETDSDLSLGVGGGGEMSETSFTYLTGVTLPEDFQRAIAVVVAGGGGYRLSSGTCEYESSPGNFVARTSENIAVFVNELPISSTSILISELDRWQGLTDTPSICSINPIGRAVAVSPTGEIVQANVGVGDVTTQVYLPVEAFRQQGEWVLRADDFELKIEIALQQPALIQAEIGYVVGLQPNERFFLLSAYGGARVDYEVVEGVADEFGSAAGSISSIQNIVGENGSIRIDHPIFVERLLEDGSPSLGYFRIPETLSEQLFYDLLWNQVYTPLDAWTCPGAAPIRLIANYQGRVRDDVALYQTPAFDAPIVTEVPAGERISIIEGVECTENSVWWQASYGDELGWVVESRNETYFVEFERTCSEYDTQLISGGNARVVAVPSNRTTIVMTPSLAFGIQDIEDYVFVPLGGTMRVLDGPWCGAQSIEWQVDYDGQVGWLTENYDETAYLAPADGENISVNTPVDLGEAATRIMCTLEPFQTSNIRSVPGTDGQVIDTFTAGQTRQADAQAPGSDGQSWWRLVDGGWVRQDTVSETGDCAALPLVSP